MKHIFESSESHPFNRPELKFGGSLGFPNGHLCLCNQIAWQESEHTTHPPFSDMFKKIYGHRQRQNPS